MGVPLVKCCRLCGELVPAHSACPWWTVGLEDCEEGCSSGCEANRFAGGVVRPTPFSTVRLALVSATCHPCGPLLPHVAPFLACAQADGAQIRHHRAPNDSARRHFMISFSFDAPQFLILCKKALSKSKAARFSMSAESLGPSSTGVLSCPQVHLAVHLTASTVLCLQVTYKSSTSGVVVIVVGGLQRETCGLPRGGGTWNRAEGMKRWPR
eukprot:1138355-Pelagomonas_calceolata.AAC.5